MTPHLALPVRKIGTPLSLLVLFAGASCLMAQDQPAAPADPQEQNAPNRGWRRADDPPPGQAQAQAEPDAAQRSVPRDEYGQPVDSGSRDEGRYDPRDDRRNDGRDDRRYDDGRRDRRDDGRYDPRDDRRDAQPAYGPVPAQLTVRPGTYITVRINQPLSTAHNQPGDAFSASLARPLVVDGIVVALRGEMIGGHVVESQRAGRVQGTSRMVIQLTDLTLVDGQQVPIRTQLINRSGPTSVGSDAGAIAGTTAVSAAIGAGADYGRGAAIGAGAGAAAGLIGVLLTRGHDTHITPESVLTFKIETPVTISTERGAQAFRYVESEDYDRVYQTEPRPLAGRPGCGPYGCGPPPRPYYGYPNFGPRISFFYGSRFGYSRHGYRRGFGL